MSYSRINSMLKLLKICIIGCVIVGLAKDIAVLIAMRCLQAFGYVFRNLGTLSGVHAFAIDPPLSSALVLAHLPIFMNLMNVAL